MLCLACTFLTVCSHSLDLYTVLLKVLGNSVCVLLMFSDEDSLLALCAGSV
jgi:hypothetical protein